MAQAALTNAAEAVWLRIPDALRPASFAARGVAVRFTTPGLALARLRPAADGGFEVAMPNVAGPGIYLVPWPALPEIFAPTLHDRLLVDELSDSGFDPERARLAQLRTAARGFAGIDAAAAAAQAIERDAHAATAVNLALIVRLIHMGGLTAGEAQEAAAAGRAAEEYRRALDRIAARLEIDARALPDRIAALSASLAAVGLREPGAGGRLRRLTARLAELRQAMAAWADSEGGDYGAVAALCAEVAGQTVDQCSRLLAAVDRRLDALIPTLRAWPRDRERLDGMRLQLAWLLDGWSRAVVLWETAPPRKHTALAAIFRALPLLPSEADGPDEAGADLAHRHRRLVRRCARLFDDDEATPAAPDLIRRLELANLRAELA
ncbi:MAG TPA: hypothetical protein VFA12_03005 [Stellaceae bacterium]|nr:hypothetical protein [Stellaceae bacterium]